MPCSDSSSGLNLRLDSHERIVNFEFAKITCSSEIGGGKRLVRYCKDKTLEEVLALDFRMLVSVLDLNDDEEAQFILYLELDALKSAIVQYEGIEHEGVDSGRCKISSVESDGEFIDIAMVILPPKELPKILPCSLNKK
jgi:NifU-like protein involved in Fe-S cluster formation